MSAALRLAPLLLAGAAEAAPADLVPGNALPGREREQFGLSPFPQRELNNDPRIVVPGKALRTPKQKCPPRGTRHRGAC